jgi:hypothetical protein
MNETIHNALRQVGINSSSLDRIQLARGVVGKSSYVAGAAILALGTIALVLREPLFLIADAVLVPLLFVFYFCGVLWFAHKHPGTALLEGAELIQWRQMDMAAKDVTQLEQQQNSAPQLLGKE